jgi:hypothetical protein
MMLIMGGLGSQIKSVNQINHVVSRIDFSECLDPQLRAGAFHIQKDAFPILHTKMGNWHSRLLFLFLQLTLPSLV